MRSSEYRRDDTICRHHMPNQANITDPSSPAKSFSAAEYHRAFRSNSSVPKHSAWKFISKNVCRLLGCALLLLCCLPISQYDWSHTRAQQQKTETALCLPELRWVDIKKSEDGSSKSSNPSGSSPLVCAFWLQITLPC
jgi:hypothetical protein